MTIIKYKGNKVEIGGQDYVFAPLPLGGIEIYGDKLDNFSDLSLKERSTTTIEIALMSLNRNYPSITREQVANMIDMHNINDIVTAIMTRSGMQQTENKAEDSGK